MKDWRKYAACLGEDPELFFPHSYSGGSSEQQIAAAQAVCASCPVRRQCLTDAIRREGAARPNCRYGIYGGLTGPQRANLWRSQQRRKQAA